MAVATTTEVKYLDAEGREVEKEGAVMALVAVYEDGHLIEEHFGLVDAGDEPAVD